MSVHKVSTIIVRHVQTVEKPLPDLPVTIQEIPRESIDFEDEKPPPYPKTRWRKWTSFCNRLWFYEVLSTIGSLSCFGTLVYVLALSDNNTQTRWFHNQLTLNSVVALLTTFIKSFMMVPVAAAISQQKWNWFSSTGRKLRDFGIFDEASRGPLGSFKLLFSELCL